MKNRHLFYILLLLFACEKEVNIKLPEPDPVLVVNCFLVEGDTVKVHVSNSGSMFDAIKKHLNEATVLLTTGNKEDTLFLNSDGWYLSSTVCQANVLYHLYVENDSLQTVFTKSEIPRPIYFEVENFIAKVGVSDEGFFYSAVDVLFQDKKEEIDYYEISYKNHKHLRTNWAEIYGGIWTEQPEIKTENLQRSVNWDLVFSDQSFNGEAKRITVNYFHTNNIDSVDILLRHVSEDYYLYKKSLARHLAGQYDDAIWGSAGTYPLYTNIENGYGIFAGYSETKQSIYTYAGGEK